MHKGGDLDCKVLSVKPGLHISRKDRKHMVGNVYFIKDVWIRLALPIVGMITSCDISQETFSIHIG